MPRTTDEQSDRRRVLVKLLEEHRIARQAELVDLLRREGFNATQSSISRDLRDLGVSKSKTGYTLPQPANHRQERELRQLGEYIRAIRPAGPNLIVIATAAGAAQRVALTLDRTQWPDIVGTLSGDDTIFIATAAAAPQRRLLARLREAFGTPRR